MAENKQFLVSVAETLLLDPNTDAFIGKATTLIDSSIEVKLSNQDVRSGFGNGLDFVYYHSREISSKLNNAQFDLTAVALNAGNPIFSGLDKVYVFDEAVTLAAGGVGSVNGTPISNIGYAKKADGNMTTVTFTGKNFTVSGGNTGDIVFVTYKIDSQVDEVEIDATTTPSIVKLIQKTKLFDNTGLIGSVYIEIPRFQISGNFSLSMTASGVSSTQIDGRALIYTDPTTNKQTYAKIKVVKNNVTGYDFIAIDTSDFTLTAGATKKLNVYGIKTGFYQPSLIDPTLITFVSATPATATVDVNGLVTGVATGSTYVSATLKSDTTKKDTVKCTI